MSEPFMPGQEPEAFQLFQKPQRRSSKSLSVIFLLLGGLIVLGGGGLLAWQLLPHQGASNGNANPTVAKGKATALDPCRSRLPVDKLRQGVADGLHLSVDQVKDEVHVGKKIQDIAAERGVSQKQLYALEIRSYQDGLAYYQRIGCLQPGDADYNRDMSYQSETPVQLNADFTNFFDILT